MKTPISQNVIVYLLIVALFQITGCSSPNPQNKSKVEVLSSNWKMQALEKLAATAEEKISQNDFKPTDWFDAIVPGTVLGSLATNKVIEDPTFGINMQHVDSMQFKKPWWYRTTFKLDGSDLKRDISLRFNGISNRADLWVNGKKVVGSGTFAGTYRMFSFNIKAYVQEGENTVALKISQYEYGEYFLGFCDWNPLPTDRSMGIFREVFLEINDGIKIRSPFVYSKVDTITKSAANLYIQAEIVNSTKEPVEGILSVDYEIGKVEKKVTVSAGDTLSYRFNPEEFPQLAVKNVNYGGLTGWARQKCTT